MKYLMLATLLGVVMLAVALAGCAPDLAALAKDKATLCVRVMGWGSTIEVMRSNPDTKDNVSVNCNGASITAPGAAVVNVPVVVTPMVLTPAK